MRLSTAPTGRLVCHRFFGCAMLAAMAVACFFGPGAWGEPTIRKSEDRQITTIITRLMATEHLTRHSLDNEISNRWMTNYLKMLDPRKVFFSQADIDGFMDYRDQLDDMALRGDTSFAYQAFHKFMERISDRVKLVDELLPQLQDFSKDEDMLTDPDQIAYAKTDAEMRDRWSKRLKYELLDLMSEKKLES